MAALTVSVFVKKPKALAYSIAALLLFNLLDMLNLFQSYNIWYKILIQSFGYILFIVGIVLASRGNEKIKKYWFAPAAVALISSLIRWVKYGYGLVPILVDVVFVAALYFAGMWLKSEPLPCLFDVKKNKAAASNKPQCRRSGADELRKLKATYDSGYLSAEEYEKLKKQILGL